MKKLALIFVLFISMLLSGCGSSSPSGVVRSFYDAVSKGDVKTATGYFSTRILNTVGVTKMQAAIQSQKQVIDQQGGIKSIDISDEQIYDQLATVNVTLVFGNGQSSTENVKLSKENGKWKIDMGK